MALEFHYHRRHRGGEEEEHFDLKATPGELLEMKEKAPPFLVNFISPHPAMVAEAESTPWVWVITFKRV